MTSAWFLVATLSLGAGVHVWLRDRCGEPPLPVGAIAWGAAGMGLWMGFLQLVGIGWRPALLALPSAAGLGAVVEALRRKRTEGLFRRPDAWALAAAALVVPQVVRIASAPASGWDFRFIWGLKARVFAMAGAHDWRWLTWSSYDFARPDYPPLWPDLLAGAPLVSGDVTRSAALWQAVLCAALAAACWHAARGATPAVRAVAAVTGAWAPFVFSPEYSGYAGPLLAFGTVVAASALADLADGTVRSPTFLGLAMVLLSLTKDEGIALASGMLLGAFLAIGLRRAAPLLMAFVPVGAWRLALLTWGTAGEPHLLDRAVLLQRLRDLPTSVGTSVPAPVAIAALAGIAAALAWRGRPARAAGVALGVWGLAVAAEYLTSRFDVAWRLGFSLDRVVSAPLPAAISLGLRGAFSAEGEAAPTAPSPEPRRRKSRRRDSRAPRP